MVSRREELERAVAIEREIARRRASDPLATMSWLPGQLAFLQCSDRIKLARSGIQRLGKSTVGAAETSFYAISQHPFRAVPQRPTLQWVVAGVERQGQNLQKKVYEFSRPYLHPESPVWDDRKGALLGKYPRLLYRNGSVVEFRSSAGDLLNLSSGTVDRVWIDEPPESERALNSLIERTTRTNGEVALTLTPQNRPVGYLRKRCEDGLITDLHYPLTLANLTFAAGPRAGQLQTLDDGTLCDEAWILAERTRTSPDESPVSIDGEWEYRQVGAWLDGAWSPSEHVSDVLPSGEVDALIGIDLGDKPGKLIAVLILVTKEGLCYVVDECVDWQASWSIQQFSAELLKMLKRNGWSWSEVHRVYTDRDHRAGFAERISGSQIQQYVAKEMGIPFERVLPPVRSAKRGPGRGKGSVQTRSSWLREEIVLGRFRVHPRCKRLIEALPRYHPRIDNDAKDPVDAVVYAATDLIYSPFRTQNGQGFRLPW